MRFYFTNISVSFLMLVIVNSVNSQTSVTPYDKLSGIIISNKPSYNESLPQFGKLLYQYPVNYNEVNYAFKKYIDKHPGIKSPIVRYAKDWLRALSPFVDNDGTIHIPAEDIYYKNLNRSQVNLMNKSNTNDGSNSDWTFLGPKETYWLNESGNPIAPGSCPWQVNVYSFDIAPSNHNVLYCGTETGFVNKTINKGLSWDLCAPNYFFGGGVTAVAIDPANENIVYVSAGNQIHKTTDGGANWTPLLEMDQLFQTNRMKVNPMNSEHILAAGNDGVFVSIDGGINWNQGLDKVSYDVEIKTDNGNMIYTISKNNDNFMVYMSGDGGQSFIPQLNFPNGISDQSGGLLAVTPDNPNLMLAVMLSSDNTPYLYKGTLVGNNWQWNLLATGQTSNFPMNNGQGYFDLVLEISPLDENLIFSGTTTLFKSSNGGQQFTAIGGYTGSFSIHPDIQDMKLLSNGETWVSTDGGFSITTDNFTNTDNYFARNNGLVGSDMWGFDQGWNEDICVGGRYHNGNTAIADFYQPKALRMGGAESPTGWVKHGVSRHVAFNDLGNGWILPESAEGQPEGRFIFSKYPNMDEYGGRRANLFFHPNYHNTIYLGEGNALWKSIDGGVSYDMVYDFSEKVRYINISYNNPSILYADIVNKGLFKSEDGGVSWELKPSLTNGLNGTSYWKGRTFFAISPFDENIIYACLQNGTWSSDIGKVFKSSDGGDTWDDWSGELSEYTKCMVIQPGNNNTDLVYLFTNARDGQSAKVYYRDEDMDNWELFNNNYPAANYVNMALPFFRDSKMRVAGNAGVWESPLQETEYTPIINPWLEKEYVNCMTDTLQFEDHSIINHEGVSWNWEIIPEPIYISDADSRNPKVVLGEEGTYSVNYTVMKNGNSYTKFLEDAIVASTCPSIDDCSNPADIPKEDWELIYVDSEEVNYPGLAIMAFDDDPSTIWHTRWSTGSDPYPHEIQIDMGSNYRLYNFTLLNRQNGSNGRIKEYQLYISEDGIEWGEPVSSGEFIDTGAPQTIEFENSVIGRYFRLVGLSEVNGNAWSSAAELSFVGCTDITYDVCQKYEDEKIIAFPVPTNGVVNVSLPSGNRFNYQIINAEGILIDSGWFIKQGSAKIFDLKDYKQGLFVIKLTRDDNVVYRVKVLKN
ncbi:MAG: hypothetical protein C0598_10405 [Marinilabiliales bacterium]|nr:MAG: hypothetical protein C0598_10405 [Marinilabiliales bacterium]